MVTPAQVAIVHPRQADARVLSEALLETGIAACVLPSDASLVDCLATGAEMLVVHTDAKLDYLDIARTNADVRVVVLATGKSWTRLIPVIQNGWAEVCADIATHEDLLDVVARIEQWLDESEDSVRVRFDHIVLLGSSDAAVRLGEWVKRLADATNPLLVVGEPGAGAESVARVLHQRRCAAAPFLKFDASSFEVDQHDSVLFGDGQKPACMTMAQQGTVFVDNVHALSARAQARLSQALARGAWQGRNGCQVEFHGRVIAATTQDLNRWVEADCFRRDLVYHFAVTPLKLAPLRSRKDDIPTIVSALLELFNRANGRHLGLSDAAVSLLRAQPWQDNLRQLQAFMERLVLLCDGEVAGADEVEDQLAQFIGFVRGGRAAQGGTTTSAKSLERVRARAERRAILTAFRSAGGNRSIAARILGVSRRTLYNKFSEYDLDPESIE